MSKLDKLHHPRGDADSDSTALMKTVGDRVRATRLALGMARRELSERSGVSPRYLAKLEAGDGNISISLLQKVSGALDAPIEHFLMAGEVQHAELKRITDLYRKADASTRARVLQVLEPERLRAQKAGRLCLVGLRGAGKSTLGARIGAALDAPFIELNDEIERSGGMPVGEIIALYGQEGYRQLESDTLAQIIDTQQRAVIAVAGGIVSAEDTFYYLLSRFHTVWLKAVAGEHMDRVLAQGDLRPMQGNPRAMIQLRQILKSREALYAQSDYQLDTSGKSVDESEAELTALIQTNRLLQPATPSP